MAEDRVHQRRAGGEHVLGVVEYEQELPRPQVVLQRLRKAPARLLAEPERRRHRLRDETRVGQRRQLDQPDAVRERFDEFRRNLQRETRLAATARTGQGEEAGPAEQRLDVGNVALAADEARELLGQVVGNRIERAQRGKGLRQVRVS